MKLHGFDFPDHLSYCLQRDLWCALERPDAVRVGISSLGVALSGNFFMCRPKAPGTELARGATLAVAEVNKSIITIKSPVAGVVLEVNPLLAEQPEILENDPYGQGWLVLLRPLAWAADLSHLAHGPGLAAALQARLALEPERASARAAQQDPPELLP